jgi:hypothetical protein
MTARLAQELEAQAGGLTARVVAEMYLDPFWSERFGERGRKFSEEDGQHHVSYLVQALVAREPEVLARYGCWLRSVLTTRGMCTRHLAENFERLESAVSDAIADASPAVEYLRAARAALQAELGDAQPLAAANERLRARVCDWLACADTTPEREGVARQLQLPRQLSSLIAFLADALVGDRVEPLLAHVRWLDSWFSRQPAGEGLVAQLLSGIGLHLSEDATLPERLRSRADALLREALAALGKPARVGVSST